MMEDLPEEVREGDEAQQEALLEVQQTLQEALSSAKAARSGAKDYQDFYHITLGNAAINWQHLLAVSEAAPWGHIRFRLQGLMAMVHQHHFLATALSVPTQLFEATVAALPAMLAHVGFPGAVPISHLADPGRIWPGAQATIPSPGLPH